VIVYNAQSSDVLHTILTDHWVHSVQFSTNSDKVFYTSWMSAMIWDLSKKEKVWMINYGRDNYSTFSHNGTHVASIDHSFLKIWTTENGYSNSETVSHHSTEIHGITFVPDGLLMVSHS
jgi:hypothetical protein